MKNRQYLKKNILLCGESDGSVFKRTFTIVKRINDEGASSICYEAYHENSGRGVLKEFYPYNAYGLERTDDGQLIPSPEFGDARERFLEAQQEYVEPYEMLLNIKQNSENQELSTFIPAFEIYHGCDNHGHIIGTTYIWTPEPKLETFDKICDEIHKHPSNNPEHKMVIALTAIESLAKCVCALHSADLIHRDIKPSNFGFINRGNETLTQTISLFDINSVCSVYGKKDGVIGTDGYMEPEALYKVANNKTDIYSIGATLFNAIIVTDEVKANKYLYDRSYYDRLREMVDESKLIKASEATSHPRLRYILTEILRKCLCDRMHRYRNCEELIDDLEEALYYALPSDIAKKKRAGEKWILKDVEKSLDKNKEKNSFLAIQYHLYEHPLYKFSSDEEINVMVIGFGNYGQKFLDVCLQSGQIRNKKLNVTVVTDTLSDKEIYLTERPQLAEFFNIDNSLREGEDSYGDIVFEKARLDSCNQTFDENTLRRILIEHYESKKPNYIFIALGDDSLNLAAANACKYEIDALNMDCVVSYICEEGHASDKIDAVLCPLYVNQDIKDLAIYDEVERMAFNTHLVWEKNLNVDFKSIKKDFKKTYNHDSCVSSVLALKYKLYSIDIDLETTSFSDAARQYTSKIEDKKNQQIRNELIWIEHRRWVAEKLCSGWKRIDNLEDCAGGVTKDEKNKKHVCIVRSRPDQKLATEYNVDGNYERWETASDQDLSQLDELDRMSVELHRMFVEKARIARNQNLMLENNMLVIRGLIEDDRKAVLALQEWFACIKDIWNGDKNKVSLYKGLKSSFFSATKGFSDERRESIEKQVKAFEALYYPILASAEYRDWKKDDVAFIDNIPFVLTYTEDIYMVIPYVIGNSTDMFGNVAAPTVVNPTRIIYLYLIEKKQDMEMLKASIPYVVEYMSKKNFRSCVEFVLVYEREGVAVTRSDEQEIMRCGGGRIRQIKSIKANGKEMVSEALESYLKRRCIKKQHFVLERNRTELSGLLQKKGLYDEFSCYIFNARDIRFINVTNCEALGYIKKKPYITVTNIPAIHLSASESHNQPDFFEDYKKLWETYSKRKETWKQLCNILQKYSESNDIIASFQKKLCEKSLETKEYHYTIPLACNRSANKVIRFLVEQGVLEQESCVKEYTADSCRVIISDCFDYRTEYNKLFSNISALIMTDDITFRINAENARIDVVYDSLMVTEIDIDGDNADDIFDLLKYFEDKEYIISLPTNGSKKICFTYATKNIKHLLTSPERMLEVYTYHMTRELGTFDDIANSFGIEWLGKEIKNEFDYILTKGFRTLFVRCKPYSNVVQASQLAELVEKVGINATAVLIMDTQRRNACDTNIVEDMRCETDDVSKLLTIRKPEEIDDIGHILLDVIDGKYKK